MADAGHTDDDIVSRVRLQANNCLGRGAHGQVFLGMLEDTGEQVAVKQIIFPSSNDRRMKEQLESITNEISVMKRLEHPNIVRYLGARRDEWTLYIFMEYVSGGTLSSLVRKFGKLSLPLSRKFMRHILNGLSYLHSLHICHRDVKGENVLLLPHGEAKLGDFGTAKQIQECWSLCNGLATICGTPWFMAPEVISGERYGLPADIWSVGCVLFEMLTGKAPYHNFENPHAAMFHIANTGSPPEIPEDLDTQAKEFLQCCFRKDPKERPSAVELLQHQFLLLSPSSNVVPSAPPYPSFTSSACPAEGPPLPPPPPPPPPPPSPPHVGEQDPASPVDLDSSSRSFGLPLCKVCNTAIAVFMCQDCTRSSSRRLCPMCWDKVHTRMRSHRKAPLLFGQGPGSPLDDTQGTHGYHYDADDDADERVSGAETWPLDSSVIMEGGQLVEMLTPEDIAAASRVPTEDDREKWPCPRCTYLNHPDLTHCEMCDSRKDRPGVGVAA